MIKKSVQTEIDTKKASLTPKEASLQSENIESPKKDYCKACKEYVVLIEKMGGFICPLCRLIVRSR